MSRILVVEDTQDSFDLVADVLGDTHELLHGRTGREGLELARRCPPDLVLLDMSVPETSGWDVVRMLKADPALATIPVIAVTAHAMSGDRERCIQAGCDDYVAKPVDVRALLRTVERSLARLPASAAGAAHLS